MPAVVDTFPFPWHLPEAQELHATLCQLYPTAKGALFVAERAGLPAYVLQTEQASFLLWRDILNEGATAQINRGIVTVARDQNPNNARRAVLDAMLAAAPVVIDHQPRAADGAPLFIRSTDDVTEPEALLFHDDLTLAIGRIPWLVAVLQRLQKLAPSVCKMRTSWPASSQSGTAFRIAPNFLLTNWHVLHYGGNRATSATAEFGYEDDGAGGGLASTTLTCDIASVRGDAAHDWAIITPTGEIADTVPIVKLSEAIEPANAAPAFIVQHPGGERKRIAYVRNQVTAFDDQVVHYLSDTQAGSSGSPVFHETGRLMALHHAGGRPQEVAGKPPLSKNEGIRIPCILQDLGRLGVVVP
jgi:Trypsin-like peptidase domain/Effector-associated domain 1